MKKILSIELYRIVSYRGEFLSIEKQSNRWFKKSISYRITMKAPIHTPSAMGETFPRVPQLYTCRTCSPAIHHQVIFQLYSNPVLHRQI